jgi:hypothetical protein
MSDENEGPPPLSPQLHEFFEAHSKTGEPTQAELGRALLRLHGATRPLVLSLGGRRFLPPEVMAVASVLVLSVGGAFIGVRVRAANAQTEALSQAKVAWVKGDLEATSAAFEKCSTPECARLAAGVGVEADIALTINERKTMVVKGLRRVAVGDAEIAEIRTLGNDRLELCGLRPGRTMLLIWKEDGERLSFVIDVIGARHQAEDNINRLKNSNLPPPTP